VSASNETIEKLTHTANELSQSQTRTIPPLPQQVQQQQCFHQYGLHSQGLTQDRGSLTGRIPERSLQGGYGPARESPPVSQLPPWQTSAANDPRGTGYPPQRPMLNIGALAEQPPQV
jgi:hypothetical protein